MRLRERRKARRGVAGGYQSAGLTARQEGVCRAVLDEMGPKKGSLYTRRVGLEQNKTSQSLSESEKIESGLFSGAGLLL